MSIQFIAALGPSGFFFSLLRAVCAEWWSSGAVQERAGSVGVRARMSWFDGAIVKQSGELCRGRGCMDWRARPGRRWP